MKSVQIQSDYFEKVTDIFQYEYTFKNELHSMNEAIYVHMEHKVSMRHKPVACNLYIIF